jgi:hypothetical protein
MQNLPFWQRRLISVVALLVASYTAGLLWQAVLNFALPQLRGRPFRWLGSPADL